MREKEYGISNEREFINTLAAYVGIDTPSGDAIQINVLSERLESELAAVGCSVRRISRPGGDCLVCTLGSGTNQLLLLGHMDTVFPDGTVAKHPFRQTADGKLFGPGVLDMKSGVCMIVEIMRHYSTRMDPRWRLTAVINADEETNSRESEDLIREEARNSKLCFCMEPSKPGYCTVARKGILHFAIDVSGVASHSGVNYLMGHSAVQALADIINRLYTLRDDETGISVNIGKISGGSKNNIVADRASLSGELRYYKPSERQRLLDFLKVVCATPNVKQTEALLRITSERPPMRQTPESKKLYDRAAELAGQHGLVLEPRTHGGGSDGSFAADEGIPVLDGLGAEGEFSHTEQEYVRVDTLMARLRLSIDLIEKCFELN